MKAVYDKNVLRILNFGSVTVRNGSPWFTDKVNDDDTRAYWDCDKCAIRSSVFHNENGGAFDRASLSALRHIDLCPSNAEAEMWAKKRSIEAMKSFKRGAITTAFTVAITVLLIRGIWH